MHLNNKNILLISPEPWDHIFVSKHHYATHLAKHSNNVFFLNPPTAQCGVKKTAFERVFNVNYTGFLKGLRYLPSFVQKQQIRKVYEHLEKLCQVKFDIVWSFDNSVFYDFSALPDNVLKISHIVDLNQDFQTEKAATTADICFAVSRSIIDKLKINNKSTFFIQHGVSPSGKDRPFTLNNSNQTKVGYAGNLDLKYIDWESIIYCVKKNKFVHFYFAGPFSVKSPDIAWLNRQPNVTLMGKVNSNSLMAFYKSMDLLFLSYKINDFPEQLTNSHKMLEYLASGKMVCATFTAEYEALQKNNLIAMCQKKQDFPVLFNKVLTKLEMWNSDEKESARKAFAFENTYEKQIARIEKILQKHQESFS